MQFTTLHPLPKKTTTQLGTDIAFLKLPRNKGIPHFFLLNLHVVSDLAHRFLAEVERVLCVELFLEAICFIKVVFINGIRGA